VVLLLIPGCFGILMDLGGLLQFVIRVLAFFKPRILVVGMEVGVKEKLGKKGRK